MCLNLSPCQSKMRLGSYKNGKWITGYLHGSQRLDMPATPWCEAKLKVASLYALTKDDVLGSMTKSPTCTKHSITMRVTAMMTSYVISSSDFGHVMPMQSLSDRSVDTCLQCFLLALVLEEESSMVFMQGSSS